MPQSYLECTVASARFYGTLDIKTLGGAGFASQRTTGDDREWDLSDYAGVQLNIAKGDSELHHLQFCFFRFKDGTREGREEK